MHKHRSAIIVFLLFCVHVFCRFYQLKERAFFGWDQIDNAWASYRILIDYNFPLQGMMARLNSGITIGPLYYYFVSIFYFFTGLHPIASPIIAGVSSIINFFVIYIFVKKLFGEKTAYIALFLNAVGSNAILADRIQWPVNFIPTFGIIIFYILYQVLEKKESYIPRLAFFVGLSFHIHFTSIFYIPIIFLTLPWWPRTRKALIYGIFSLLIFAGMLLPNIASIIYLNKTGMRHMVLYGTGVYHGFHLKRMLQLYHDAFIQFESIMGSIWRPFVFAVIPFFIFFHRLKTKKYNYLLYYLLLLWIGVPWIVFTAYSGEISEYYFSINKYISLAVISYCIAWLFEKNKFLKIMIVCALIYYAFAGIQRYFSEKPRDVLRKSEETVRNTIFARGHIPFVEGSPESYMYAIFRRELK